MFNIIDTTKYFIFDSIKKMIFPSSKQIINQIDPLENIKPYESKNQYDQKEIDSIRETLKYMESRGEENPYSLHIVADKDRPELGEALGAYQITEARLKERGEQFLGKSITKDEFLNNPKLQDMFIDAQTKFLRDRNFKIDTLFATHRGGWSDMTTPKIMKIKKERKNYMDEAMEQYNKNYAS